MEQEFKIIMDNVPAIVFKGYLDGAIDPYNQKVEAVTGYTKEEFDSPRVKMTDLVIAIAA